MKRSLEFQEFMTVSPSPKDPSWYEVKNRMLDYCEEVNNLCLALAKYDYSNAPSNWRLRFHQEETIWDWAEDIREEIEKGTYDKDDIDELIDDYLEGYIPDFYEQMIDFFC